MKDLVWDSLIPPNLQTHRRSESDSRNYFIDIEHGVNTEGEKGYDDSSSNSSSSLKDEEVLGGRLRQVSLPGGGPGGDNLDILLDATCKKKSRATRLVRKSGGVNLKISNVEDKGERYVMDFFTTLVFAAIWWVIVRAHGDMDHFEEDGWSPCVEGVQSFTSIFLFSLETQHTIGYGYHRMTDQCMEAVILLVIQSIFGVIVESLTVGVFIVKLSRSKKRAQTVIFSKHAVICKKDDGLVLVFRVADVGKSMLLEAHIRAQLITKKIGKSGKVILNQQSITVEGDDQDEDRLMLFWPTDINHEIDKDSPFYQMTPDNFRKSCDNQFEVVVVLEGIVESTGMTTQARTSYLPSEILWGHQFLNLLHEGTKYTANMELFHVTFPLTEMTDKSAQELDEEGERESRDS